MSDCRLCHEEGFVEDEVEVRVEEYTLRGGQESYRRNLASYFGDGEINQAYAIASVASHCVSRFGNGVGESSNCGRRMSGVRPKRTKEAHRCVWLLRNRGWEGRTGNQAVRLVKERGWYRTLVEPTKVRG